jgi:hypothetical protein
MLANSFAIQCLAPLLGAAPFITKSRGPVNPEKICTVKKAKSTLLTPSVAQPEIPINSQIQFLIINKILRI